MDFALSPELAELEAELSRFAARELRPRLRELEAAGHWDVAILKAFDGFAVPGLDLPEAWGGAGAGTLAKVVALEVVAGGDAGGLPGADPVGPAAAALLACPDQALAGGIAQACLAREGRCVLAAGGTPRLQWAPGGTAPAWVWLSEGATLAVYATADHPARPVVAGAFTASGGVGLDLSDARPLAAFDIGRDGGLELRGRARLWPAAVALGVAAAALDYAVAYTTERVVMGKPVAHHQANAFALAEVSGLVEAGRASARAAAWSLDAGRPGAGLSATLAFLDAADAALAATDLCVQLLGGHGYIEDHPAEKWFREARALAGLLGGTLSAVDDAAGAVLEAPAWPS